MALTDGIFRARRITRMADDVYEVGDQILGSVFGTDQQVQRYLRNGWIEWEDAAANTAPTLSYVYDAEELYLYMDEGSLAMSNGISHTIGATQLDGSDDPIPSWCEWNPSGAAGHAQFLEAGLYHAKGWADIETSSLDTGYSLAGFGGNLSGGNLYQKHETGTDVSLEPDMFFMAEVGDTIRLQAECNGGNTTLDYCELYIRKINLVIT